MDVCAALKVVIVVCSSVVVEFPTCYNRFKFANEEIEIVKSSS